MHHPGCAFLRSVEWANVQVTVSRSAVTHFSPGWRVQVKGWNRLR